MNSLKKIYILLGPKGSGKSFIGSLLEQERKIKFLRVEDIALQMRKGRKYDHPDYLIEVFKAIETHVRYNLESTDELIFESTGLTDQFDAMLIRLQQDFKVILIEVRANLSLCLERIKMRNQSIHIAVSDEHIHTINSAVLAKKFPLQGILDNDNAHEDMLLKTFDQIRANVA